MINDQGRAHWYGPKGEQRIFEPGEEVPDGWRDHPFEPKRTGSFDRDGKDGPGGSLPSNVLKLKSIAKAENIDLGEAKKAAEIKALILAARTG